HLCKSEFDKVTHRVAFASSQNIIIRLRVLQHEPHSLYEVACVTPIAPSVEVTHVKLVLKPKLDRSNGASDLAGYKGLASQWTFMVEENAVAGEHAIGLTVIDRDPICVKL